MGLEMMMDKWAVCDHELAVFWFIFRRCPLLAVYVFSVGNFTPSSLHISCNVSTLDFMTKMNRKE